MVRAWYMDTKEDDQRLPHTTEVLSLVSPNQLKQLGVETWKITVGPEEKNFSTPELERIRSERNYVNYDIVTIHPEKLPNYEEKVRNFFNEHLHIDEEIRFVLDGSGYFDVRDRNEKWIRIEVLPGDLLVLPAGIYHRFTTDTKNFAKAMRLFKEEPVWTPYNRGSEADKMAARQAYVERFYNSPVPLVPSVEHKKTFGVNGEGFVLTSAAQAKANYPHLRRVNGMLYVSGASSRRFDNTFRGATPNGDGTFTLDVAEQTRGVIENIRACLNAAGADLEHLVDVTCFLTDMKLYADFNKAYNEYFNLESGPTRTTVAVKELPGPLIQVEIKAVAVDPHFQR